MPRIAGFDIPDHKKIAFSLQSIYGVGPSVADTIVEQAKIDPETRARDLTADEISRISKELDKVLVGGNLRRVVRDNIDRLKRIKSYRGDRHRAGLPVRGQNTRTNARTNRGKRRTVGALSKEAAAKLETAKAGK